MANKRARRIIARNAQRKEEKRIASDIRKGTPVEPKKLPMLTKKQLIRAAKREGIIPVNIERRAEIAMRRAPREKVVGFLALLAEEQRKAEREKRARDVEAAKKLVEDLEQQPQSNIVVTT